MRLFLKNYGIYCPNSLIWGQKKVENKNRIWITCITKNYLVVVIKSFFLSYSFSFKFFWSLISLGQSRNLKLFFLRKLTTFKLVICILK